MISRHFVLGLAVALGIGAYPLLAALMSLMGLPTEFRAPSIVLRIGVALIALIATFMNRKSLRLYHPVFLGCFAVFWALYIFRVVSNAYISQVELGVDPVEVLAMIGIFVLLPTMPMFAGLNPWSSAWGFTLLSVLTAVTLIIVMPQFGSLAASLQDKGAIRFALDRLNPISVGYVGATMLVLSVVGVFQSAKPSSWLVRGLFLASGAVGLFALIISASRGPAIATALALVVYALLPMRSGRLFMGLIGLGAMAMVSLAVRRFVLVTYEFDLYSRILDTPESEASGTGREASFAGAWQQFLDNPFFGDAIIERSTGTYPHNLVLEALMATGIFGGIAYLLMLGLLLVASLRLVSREGGYEWIGLLGILFGVSGMFSGAHYTSDIQWLTLVLVVTTEIKLRSMVRTRPVVDDSAFAVG